MAVTCQLGETRQARLNLLITLVELGVPLKVLLENLEFSNASNTFERMSQEALAKIALTQMQSGATLPPKADGGTPGGPI